jgi:hypothetical protein
MALAHAAAYIGTTPESESRVVEVSVAFIIR